MIDLKVLRENPELVKNSQSARNESGELVDQLIILDEKRRVAISNYEQKRAEQNLASKQVAAAKGEEKEKLLVETKALSALVKEAEAIKDQCENDFQDQFKLLHNLIDLDAPVGGEADFKEIELVGKPRDFKGEGFEPKDHVELGKILKAIDVERGTKVSGSRFYYLTGPGAMLEFALVNYAITSAAKAGFIPMIPPVLVKPHAMEGTGFLGQAAENVFHLEKDEFYLVGTSEVPLAAYHRDEILDNLPIRYVGYSSCFRREAGTYGKDTRGIIRVHQFDKVEMFSYCAPEDSKSEHLKLLQWEKEFLNAMEIPYRVIDVASGDLGASAARKFDCEAWIPTQGTYREVTSTSNCTEFQARRLNIKYKSSDGNKFAATLNGTLVAIPRMIVAILENHQQKDGSVILPKALVPFMGTDRLTPA